MNLVADLALIMIAAGVFTIISKALKQPLILGYIVAGFLVGPHMGLFPTVTSTETVEQWSEIGIIFLLFGLGLEFSFKKLLQVGSSALITAAVTCVGMFIMGFAAGQTMSWSLMESIFLGGMLSMSSTTIIIKAYDDLGVKNKPYANMVFGILVIEDLIAVLLMVLLSTLAVSQTFDGGQMLAGLLKLVFSILLWFLVGIFVIPTILKKAHDYLSDEILLLVSLGLCFGMVSLATAVGFSSALGAFVMGSILSETVEGERISHLTSNIKNLFGAVFFVSVGMMVDPTVIGAHFGTILLITIVAMGGILFFSTTGALLSGLGLDNSVHVGFSLAQLGEFSFIIAGLGSQLGVMRGFIYPVIIAVSVITTFTTPYMIKLGDPAAVWLRRKLPQSFLDRVEPSADSDRANSMAAKSEWKKLLKSYVLRIVLYGVVLLAILMGSRLYLGGLAAKVLPSWSETLRNALVVLTTLIVMAPFLYGMGVSGTSINHSAVQLLREKDSNKWPILGLVVLRSLIVVGFVLTLILEYFHLAGWTILLIVVAGFILIVQLRRSVRRFDSLENRFMTNLNAREMKERRAAPVAASVNQSLAGYDVRIGTYILNADSSFVGQTLKEIPFRATTGANVVKIVRGSQSFLVPPGSFVFYPGDKIIAVGTSTQIESLSRMLSDSVVKSTAPEKEFSVEKFEITEKSSLFGKTLREANTRPSGCMLISYLRDGVFQANPGPDYVFEAGDVVWMAGEKNSINWFK